MGKNKIILNGQSFDDTQIKGGNVFISTSLACDDLAIDTLDTNIDFSGYQNTKFVPKNSSGLLTKSKLLFCVQPSIRILATDPSQFVYGQKVEYYRDNVLFASFYMISINRVNKFVYAISCVSAIGLLENEMHYGGIYTGQTVPSVLSDIMGGIVSYTLDSAFNNVRVYGWLPIGTRRENLQQLLFAEGGSVFKNTNGTLRFAPLKNENENPLADNRVYMGGDVKYHGKITSVSITEHTYTAYSSDKESTLFEGNVLAEQITTPKGSKVSGTIITFNAPMHNLAVSGATILESGANYAVLGASTACKLTGKEYTHTTRVVSKSDSTATRAVVSAEDNEAVVKDATLVTLVNVESVADRIYSYYKASRTVETGLVVGNERPGSKVTLNDPFGEPATGFIQSMDINISNTLKAISRIVAGFVPTDTGNYYTHSIVITSNRNWTVPEECKGKIRVVLISGGQGGGGGQRGGSSTQVTVSYTSSSLVPIPTSGYGLGLPGKGGAGGTAGHGGRILQATLNVEVGQVLAVQIGTGGAGGAPGTSSGSEGGETKIGSLTSSDGSYSDLGYVDSLTGIQYAAKGKSGLAGGNGSGGVSSVQNDSNIESVSVGNYAYDEDGNRYSPGATLMNETDSSRIRSNYASAVGTEDDLRKGGIVSAFTTAQPGSGAAAGSNGASSTSLGSVTSSGSGTSRIYASATGLGALNGASATKTPRAVTNAKGGTGGYGGGGAGGHGAAIRGAKTGEGVSYIGGSVKGGGTASGGSGSYGGRGGDGLAIIYW